MNFGFGAGPLVVCAETARSRGLPFSSYTIAGPLVVEPGAGTPSKKKFSHFCFLSVAQPASNAKPTPTKRIAAARSRTRLSLPGRRAVASAGVLV